MTVISHIMYPTKKLEASDATSGTFNSMLGLGQMIGPFYGSYVTAILDFRICTSFFGIFLICFCFVYYLVEFRQSNKEIDEEAITEMKNKSFKSNLSHDVSYNRF